MTGPFPDNPSHHKHQLAPLQSLRLPLIQYLLLYLVVLCVYLPTFWYTYVWDDFGAITSNESIREWKNIPRFFTDPGTFTDDPGNFIRDEWRPLRNIYYLTTYKLHGLHPAGWHFHHVLLHALAASLLLAFFHRIFRYARACPADQYLPRSVTLAAWLAALTWAIHPANTEVTAWLKSADDILACIFGLAAMITLFPASQRLTWPRAIAGATLYTLALLSKESIPPLALIYPVLFLLLAPRPVAALRNIPFIGATGALLALTFGYVILRKILLGQIGQVDYLAGNLSLMMATMVGAVVRYLQLTFWPFWPTVQIGDYKGWPLATTWLAPQVLTSLIILATAAVIILYGARRNRILLAGWLFAGLAFAPVSNIIPMMQVMAERFMYFPLMGIALAYAGVLAPFLDRPPAARILIPVAIAVAMGVTTLHRLPIWSDNSAFQTASKDALPTSYRAKYNYAVTLVNDGKTTQGLEIIESVYIANPDFLAAGMSTADLHFILGNETTGTYYLNALIQDYPGNPRPLAYAADRARIAGNTAQAAIYYDRALLIDKTLPMLWYFTGEMHHKLGHFRIAKLALTQALKLNPDITSATLLLQSLPTTPTVTHPQ